MADKPILFSGEMVRAILDGRKTQTRRVIKPQPQCGKGIWCVSNAIWRNTMLEPGQRWKCPYGQVGDRLWVREAYQATDSSFLGFSKPRILTGYYLLDTKSFKQQLTVKEWDKFKKRKHPFYITTARFMYKSLARIWLEITGIRVEKVQDITEEDAKTEGVLEFGDTRTLGKYPIIKHSFKPSFRILWNSINQKRGYGWEKNPWVWVIEFKELNDG